MISDGKHVARSMDSLDFPAPVAPITTTTFSFSICLAFSLFPLQGMHIMGCLNLHMNIEMVIVTYQDQPSLRRKNISLDKKLS